MIGARVLLVEDDRSLGTVWAMQLRRAGYAVRRAATLRAAREVLAAHPCDVVLLDLQLPDGDGETLARELRGSGRGIPVVVVSGLIDARRALSLLDLCVAALPKPIGQADLVRAISRALTTRRSYVDEVDAFSRLHQLSGREADVVRAAAVGVAGDDLAHEFRCTTGTLATYWHRVFQKTGESSQRGVLAAVARFIHDRADAVAARGRVASPLLDGFLDLRLAVHGSNADVDAFGLDEVGS